MRTSAIPHPENEPLLLIRKSYLTLCGNHCAAGLLSVFEYWHNVRLNQIEQEKARAATEKKYEPNLSTWIYKTHKDLCSDMLGLYGVSTVSSAVSALVLSGFVETKENELNPFDKTRMYRLQINALRDALKNTVDSPPVDDGSIEIKDSTEQNQAMSLEETTSLETTSTENNSPSPSSEELNLEDQIETFIPNAYRRERGVPMKMTRRADAQLVAKVNAQERQYGRAIYRAALIVFLRKRDDAEARKAKWPLWWFAHNPEAYMLESKLPDIPIVADPAKPQTTAEIRNFPSEWNTLVPAMPVQWNGTHGPLKALGMCAKDPIFCDRFEEMCGLVQTMHEIRGTEVSWLTFAWVLKNKKDEGYGWWRILTDLRGMAIPRSEPKSKYASILENA